MSSSQMFAFFLSLLVASLLTIGGAQIAYADGHMGDGGEGHTHDEDHAERDHRYMTRPKNESRERGEFDERSPRQKPETWRPRPNSRRYRGSWAYGLYLDRLGVDNENLINPETGTREVGDEAFSLGVRGEYLAPADWSIGIYAGIVDFNDDAEIVQDVEGFFGDFDRRVTDVQALQIGIDAGPQFYFGDRGSFSLSPRVGFMAIGGEQREINDCIDCVEEDLEIDGGVYFGVDARMDVGSFVLGLSARGFNDGDLNDSLSIFFQSHF